MSDEKNAKPTDAPVVEQTKPQPVDTPVEPASAHPEFESPEKQLGQVMKDPWEDDSQTDWPNGHIDYPGLEAN